MSKETEVNEKKKKGGKIVLASCIFIILILIGVIVVLLLDKGEPKKKRDVVVTEKNAEKIVEEMAEEPKVPMGSYQVTMNPTWKFDNSAVASSNAYVENAETNTNSVYFDVIRSDTEEVIYESPIIPVGSHLDEIVLDADLAAGTYDAVVVYHILDENDESMSTVRVGITIVINN